MILCSEQQQKDMIKSVIFALEEDIGSGDITAELIPETEVAGAKIITREDCTIAGRDWVNEVFAQLDHVSKTNTAVDWLVNDGDQVAANTTLFQLHGQARTLLSGERTALNFVQLLSGTATACRRYAEKVKHTAVKLLDTRKTIPGLRSAQKYAVTCGGCYNHRLGLYDAFLIKENHIAACGGIASAIERARANHPDKPVEIEVENLEELSLALQSKADIVMLDNFSLEQLQQGVALNQGRARLEASGGITDQTLVPIAETGVDFISIGALTKDCRAIDLSMQLITD
ncbi:MAG: carboxylating nicotinate-nucleotide diphosphorylase [Pseudomonadota bacterium]